MYCSFKLTMALEERNEVSRPASLAAVASPERNQGLGRAEQKAAQRGGCAPMCPAAPAGAVPSTYWKSTATSTVLT